MMPTNTMRCRGEAHNKTLELRKGDTPDPLERPPRSVPLLPTVEDPARTPTRSLCQCPTRCPSSAGSSPSTAEDLADRFPVPLPPRDPSFCPCRFSPAPCRGSWEQAATALAHRSISSPCPTPLRYNRTTKRKLKPITHEGRGHDNGGCH